MKSTISSVTACVLVACAPPMPFVIPIGATFDNEHARVLMLPGTNTVKGSALIRQRGGGTITCAGKEVQLIPATAYAAERMRVTYGRESGGYDRIGSDFAQRRMFATTAPGYLDSIRRTRCDAQGYFKFEKIADGSFFVVTTVSWRAREYFTEGGSLMQSVQLAGGESRELVLSPGD